MYKMKNDSMPQSLTEMFKIRENQIYDLRSNNKNFALEKPETNFMKKSIRYSAAFLWNSLPDLAKETNISLNQFKFILDC